MTLIVHLGAHRTASTHLQQSLSGARRALMDAGVWYAGPDETRGAAFPLIAASRRRGEALRPDAARVIAAAARIWPALLISDENIVGGTTRTMLGGGGVVYPQAAAQIGRVAALAGLPLTLALAVREPSAFLASAFGLQAAYGKETVPAAYLGTLHPERLRWSELAARLIAVPGVAGLIVWRHEDYRPLRGAILSRLLPPAAVRAVGDPPALNTGLSDAAWRRLQDRLRADPTLAQAPARLARLARQIKSAHPARPGEGMALFDAATVARSRAAYAEDMAVLAALPGVDWLAP